MLITEKALFAFVDLKDPFSPGEVAEHEQIGPILSILGTRAFSNVFLFHTPQTAANADLTRQEVRQRYPGCKCGVFSLPVSDPKDYSALMGSLASLLRKLRSSLSPQSENFFSVSSGTAEMRAAWFLLNTSGFLRGTMVQIGSPTEPLFGSANVQDVSFDDPDWRAFADLIRPQEYLESRVMSSRMERQVSEIYEAREQLETEHLDIDGALRELNIHISSAVMRQAVERAAFTGAESDLPVLLFGETGTGKEMFAKLVHRVSSRHRCEMVSVNCAAIPKELVESHLFGHVKGAFTGAVANHSGKFEAAHNSTLFLDEIGELSLDAQAKILRALNGGTIEVVGAGREKAVDVRIVAATHRDLKAEIAAGRFREDLYYRLSVVEISLPPLRSRAAEIPELAAELLRQINQRQKRKRQLSPDALKALVAYPWPGNVRQLNNVLQRAALFATSGTIDAKGLELPMELVEGNPYAFLPEPGPGFELKKFVAEVRRRMVERAMAKTGGNQTEAAALLGVSKQAVSKILSGEPDYES